MFGDVKRKNLTLFTKSSARATDSNPTTPSAIIRSFVQKLNNNNSGIIDSLCSLIQEIIKNDPIEDQNETPSIMDNELLELVVDTINALGITFVDEILSIKTTSDLENKNVSIQCQQFKRY